ncbi:hypothetical protein Ahy_B03g066970 [Arachis hypogaea]|uniref:Aminotransferase-like plant mobile domain-containing protein n=1 Tax=Arachis hypogaea TaxID=3818 RepID=A0A445A5G1_ARAHY|nr:hypothetical protein Ahy_B03g066970 [Arachis hypogaea]
MEDEKRFYRLNGVAHVAGTINEEPTRCIYNVRTQQNMPLHDRIIPYLERVGLYHLTRLNAHWFWLDEPLDVAYQLGLPVDGQPVSECMTDFHLHIEGARPAWEWFQELFGELPPPDKRKLYTVHFTWFHERFKVLSADAFEETVRIYAPRLDDMGSYSWVQLRWHGCTDTCVGWSIETSQTWRDPYNYYSHGSFGGSPH